MSVREILIRARALIEQPIRLTQGVIARAANRHYVSATDPEATCWCAEGALVRAAEEGAATAVDAVDATKDIAKASRLLSDQVGGRALYRFNDDPRTTHADVLKAFDLAIKAA